MAYSKGVYTSEVPTSLTPPVAVGSAIPFVIGTAPVHTVEGDISVNKVLYISNYSEAVQMLGYSDDWEKYTLCEFMFSQFALYGMGPVVFVNVFDPAIHNKEIKDIELSFENDEIILSNGMIRGSLKVKTAGGSPVDCAENVDYMVDYVDSQIFRIPGSENIEEGATVVLEYLEPDPEQITSDDIVGGADPDGNITGLELVNQVYPKTRELPGLIVAPGFSQDNVVAAVMTNKTKKFNDLFNCMAIIDIDDTIATKYSDVQEYKNQNNLTDPNQIVCWPKVKLGDKIFHLSTQIAGLIARTDSENSDVPYASPSNNNLQIDGSISNGEEVSLDLPMANYLVGQGIVTTLNFSGGWVLWGNRTACYPANTDPKDSWIPVKRMFHWVGNTLILTFWQKLDSPANRRLIYNILDSAQMWMSGLVAGEFLLAGKVEFRADENNIIDLMDGAQAFHISMTPPSPAKEINFIQEYDPTGFAALFS